MGLNQPLIESPRNRLRAAFPPLGGSHAGHQQRHQQGEGRVSARSGVGGSSSAPDALDRRRSVRGRVRLPGAVMKTSTRGREAIKKREGVVLKAYRDSVGVLSIGVGHTSAAGNPTVMPGMTITAQQADDILTRDLERFENIVNNA